jgi:predicted metal-dependent phosphoesterase TrpH
MSPRKIVDCAVKEKIDILAICDHNSMENVPAVMNAARKKAVTVFPGMEVCTKEEIHVIALFENLQSAFEMQTLIYGRLYGQNDEKAFGMQIVANEEDEVLGFNTNLLIGAADISIDQTVMEIHRRHGLVIASHIDRESYSIIGQLGFIPAELTFDALEISRNMKLPDAREKFKEYASYQFIQNSDAHFLKDFGTVTTDLLIEETSFKEIMKAFRREDGRMILE